MARLAHDTFRPLGKTGIEVTALAYGSANLGFADQDRHTGDVRAAEVLAEVWRAGIRHFDTAPHYDLGVCERRLGAFLAQKPRDEFVLSTKVGRIIVDGPDGQPKRLLDYSADGLARALADSHDRMGIDRFDILYVHDIGELVLGVEKNEQHYAQLRDSGFAYLDDLKARGVIRAWGLGVNEVAIAMRAMADTQPDCFLMANQHSLLTSAASRSLFPACRDCGIGVTIGGVFNGGILATGAVPGALFMYRPASEITMQRVREIQTICARHNVALPAAALQYPKSERSVASILFGTADAKDVRRNIDHFTTPIPQALWSDLLAWRAPTWLSR